VRSSVAGGASVAHKLGSAALLAEVRTAFIHGMDVLMSVMALATAWSPAFPFGATANPAADLSPGTIRDTIADMVARIVRVDQPPEQASVTDSAHEPG
jgi:hypothetical protein